MFFHAGNRLHKNGSPMPPRVAIVVGRAGCPYITNTLALRVVVGWDRGDEYNTDAIPLGPVEGYDGPYWTEIPEDA